MKSQDERINKLLKQFAKLQEEYPNTIIHVKTDIGDGKFRLGDMDFYPWSLSNSTPRGDFTIDLGHEEL